MSTELKTDMKRHTVTRYWGGNDRGVCLQITCGEPLHICNTIEEQIQQEGFIQLTMEEAAALCNNLMAFIKEEAKRRQALLRKEVVQKKEFEESVFREIANLPTELVGTSTISVELISRLCPKTL